MNKERFVVKTEVKKNGVVFYILDERTHRIVANDICNLDSANYIKEIYKSMYGEVFNNEMVY